MRNSWICSGLVALGLGIGASTAGAWQWIYPPTLPAASISCIDACIASCGLPSSPPAPLSLESIVRMRRALIEP